MKQKTENVAHERAPGPTMLGYTVLVGALFVFLAAGCATKYPAAPAEAATADYNYRIGPLDVVNVIVWRNPELSTSVPIRPDGKVTTPLIDDVQALGKTPTELSRDLEKALVKYIRDYYLQFNMAPMVRKVCKSTGFQLKEIYDLFPSGPAKGVCKVAGLPKPTGCV